VVESQRASSAVHRRCATGAMLDKCPRTLQCCAFHGLPPLFLSFGDFEIVVSNFLLNFVIDTDASTIEARVEKEEK